MTTEPAIFETLKGMNLNCIVFGNIDVVNGLTSEEMLERCRGNKALVETDSGTLYIVRFDEHSQRLYDATSLTLLFMRIEDTLED